jgi:acyl-CoA synthetase (AMP-forming)/AMP-acid ligase II
VTETLSSRADAVRVLTAPGAPYEMVPYTRDGVTRREWLHAPRSLRAVLEASLAHGDRPFLVLDDEVWSYADHHRAVAALADHLAREVGVGAGDRVGIAMRNLPEWSVALFAVTALGAVAVPFNAWWGAAEMAAMLAETAPVAMVVDAERAARLAAATPTPPPTLVARPDGPPPLGIDLGAILAASTAVELPPADVGPDDVATLFTTSGTTGRAKAAIGTHRNVCTNLLSRSWYRDLRSVAAGGPFPPPPALPATTLLTIPLFHVTGCHSYLVPTLASGGTLVLMHRWDPAVALDLVERHRITSLGGVPTVVVQLLDAYDPARHDVSSLASLAMGGAPVPPSLIGRIERLLPGRVVGNGYGMTETSAVAVYAWAEDCVEHPDSIGRPPPVVDVRVVGDDGHDVAPGTPGELWLRGPNIVLGYWGRPDDTREAFVADGWLRTGDVVTSDPEGRVRIVDRRKDLVVRAGENVAPAEVEAALHAHPDVVDAGVVGMPDDVLGERVAAVVQVRAGATVTPDALRGHVADRLARFKVPAEVLVVDGPLPRNPQGKLLRPELRAMLTSPAGRAPRSAGA